MALMDCVMTMWENDLELLDFFCDTTSKQRRLGNNAGVDALKIGKRKQKHKKTHNLSLDPYKYSDYERTVSSDAQVLGEALGSENSDSDNDWNLDDFFDEDNDEFHDAGYGGSSPVPPPGSDSDDSFEDAAAAPEPIAEPPPNIDKQPQETGPHPAENPEAGPSTTTTGKIPDPSTGAVPKQPKVLRTPEKEIVRPKILRSPILIKVQNPNYETLGNATVQEKLKDTINDLYLLTDATQAALAQAESPEEKEIAKQYFGAATRKIKNTYGTLSPLVDPNVLKSLHAEVGKSQLNKAAPPNPDSANENLAKYKARQQLLKRFSQEPEGTQADHPSTDTVKFPIGDPPTSQPTGAAAEILRKRLERKSILKNPQQSFPQNPHGSQQELNPFSRESIRTRSHPEIPETPFENDPEALLRLQRFREKQAFLKQFRK
jgi:hypothetical protein